MKSLCSDAPAFTCAECLCAGVFFLGLAPARRSHVVFFPRTPFYLYLWFYSASCGNHRVVALVCVFQVYSAVLLPTGAWLALVFSPLYSPKIRLVGKRQHGNRQGLFLCLYLCLCLYCLCLYSRQRQRHRQSRTRRPNAFYFNNSLLY